ncbi:MAG: Hsp20/alpha crystallin family protein [Desulfobacterales bacterium]|uniref:Hsp20/alpha crystallin family protein n=1 Tax=Candidatus Desulfatibia vada TaxID=2841696 RepID=A0A8J6P159_9BACT|nr:Hsp20/alpha crystallin family protein [Candidatus Desulfatibia vada]
MIYRRLFNIPTWRFRRPSDELDRLRRQMSELYGALSGDAISMPAAGVFPLTNVTEDSGNYYVRAELPGMKSDELNIQVTSDGISISGERKIPEEGNGVKYHRREREAGKFSRSINLPGEIDVNAVEASLNNGILTITIQKAEVAKPRQITVK